MSILIFLLASISTSHFYGNSSVEGLAINGLQPGMNAAQAIAKVRPTSIRNTANGWEIRRKHTEVGFNFRSPLKVSWVKGVQGSTLESDGEIVLTLDNEMEDFSQELQRRKWTSKRGEPNRLYWASEDAYFRLRLQPKSMTKVHEIALLDEIGLQSLSFRKPTFLSQKKND